MAKTPNESAPEWTDTPGSSEPDGTAPDSPTVLPTEQLETTPLPVSASAAASGGATGLGGASEASPSPTTPRENQTVFRRHPLASGIVAGIAAVLVVSSLTAWGVGAAVTASLTNQSSPVAPLSTSTPAPDADGEQGGRLATGRLAFRATIQQISGSTWTILTRRGQTVTVTITGSTRFGTKQVAESLGSFAVGDSVLIVATRVDGTATAMRVVSSQDVGNHAGENDSGSDGADPTPTPSPTSSATT